MNIVLCNKRWKVKDNDISKTIMTLSCREKEFMLSKVDTTSNNDL